MADPKPTPSPRMGHLSLAWLTCMMIACSDAVLAQEDPKEIVAAAVRQHGHECDRPESVKPDKDHSTPGQKAWVIECENGAYRVKFLGDTGAEVEPLR
jgi:hypothetical protein